MAEGDAGPHARASEATILRTVQSFGAVIAPSALITALLYYFGWAKAQSFSQYFGLDVSLFGLSTQDYLLQSIRSVFIPLGVLLFSGLALLWAHAMVLRQLELDPGRPLWPRLAGGLAATGVALFVFGLVKNAERYPSDFDLIVTPLAMLLGLGLTSYGVLVNRRRRRPKEPPDRAAASAVPSAGPMSVPGLGVILVSMLLAVGLVWSVANYAEVKGREEGEFVHDQLAFLPGVVVYSEKRLHIAAAGVDETTFSDPEAAFAFRYQGLKLLFHSNGRFFLVPTSWSLTNGTTIVLDEGDGMRLEFVRPQG